MKNYSTKTAFFLFAGDLILIFGILLLLEVFFRLFPVASPNRILRNVYEPVNKYGGYQFKAGARTICNNGFGDHPFEINSWRCRDKEYGEKQDGEFRILCVGDSFNENQAVAVEDIYPNVLEKLLSDKYLLKSFSVINAGMAGWGLWSIYEYLEDMLSTVKPDVVIVGFEASAKAVTKAVRPPFKEKIIFAGLPIDKEAPMSQRLKWGAWFINQTLECYSYAYSAFRTVSWYPFAWMKIVPEPQFHPMSTIPNYYEKTFQPTLDVTRRLKSLCEENRCKLVILNIPLHYECRRDASWLKTQLETPDVTMLDVTRPSRFIKEIGHKLNTPVYDPSKELHDSIEPPYFPRFYHWNKCGNIIVASGLLHLITSSRFF